MFFVGILKVYEENSRNRIQDLDPDPNPDPLVRGMDPGIRIHTKMSWIRNTALNTIKTTFRVSCLYSSLVHGHKNHWYRCCAELHPFCSSFCAHFRIPILHWFRPQTLFSSIAKNWLLGVPPHFPLHSCTQVFCTFYANYFCQGNILPKIPPCM